MTPWRQLILPGDDGSDVRAVKRAGKKMGAQGSRAVKVSNHAGTAFVHMIKSVQRNHGLPDDGKYGPKTHAIFARHFDAYGVQLYKRAKLRHRISHWVVLAPDADRPGVHTRQVVLDFVAKVAREYGQPLVIGTGTNHNQYVKGTHNQSDHWTGHAADVPATGLKLLRVGQAALRAAGMARWRAAICWGGVYNVGGHNILFRTTVGGNHWNHCHMSAY